MHVYALQPSLSPQSVTRRATIANEAEMALRSRATIERAPQQIDPKILKTLSASASVSHSHSHFVVSVETIVPGRRAFQDERRSCQLLARSFDDFRRLRRSLLLRVGGHPDASSLLSGKAMKCRCEGAKGCSFDVARTFLDRLKFAKRVRLLSNNHGTGDLEKRQAEVNNFLQIVFAILHRTAPAQLHAECRFLQDVLAFLEVEEGFCEHLEEMLNAKQRRMSLDGWKAHTLETYGAGIRV